MADTKGERGFLARWSERKEAARQGATAPADTPRQPSDGAADVRTAEDFGARPNAGESARDLAPDPGSGQVQERFFTDADMPALDTLDGFSDYSGFLSEGVSASLRRRALAQLFRSPHLNVTDGLDDFAEDYTGFEAMGDLITADMRHRLALAAGRLAGDKREAAVEMSEDTDGTPPAHRMAGPSDLPQPSPAAQGHGSSDVSIPDAGPEQQTAALPGGRRT